MYNAELFRLAYVSDCVLPEELDVLTLEITQILERASRQNAANDVTGALFYSGGYFCQVMEGDPDYLQDLFDRIQRDRRHRDCKVVLFEPIEHRAFGDWHMAFAGLELRTSIEIEGILKSPAAINTDQKGRDVIDFLLGKVVNRIRLHNS